MERLTEKRDGKNVITLRQDGKVKWALCSAGMGNASTKYLYGEHADRLAEYEDAEEQGLLLRLPCKVGDTVWIVGTKCLADVVPIEECKRMQCDDCPYNDEDIVFKDKADARMISYLILETHELFVFGKTVFLTKEEAEAKLKEMRGEEE